MPYDKVILPWNKVAKRIDELIAGGRFMTGRELAYIPEYEKLELSREIHNFYPMQPEDLPRPFPRDMDHWQAVRDVVRPQLDEPERVAEIPSQMAAILDNTADFDAVIIGHSQFEKIPMSVEWQEAMLRRQINELLEGIDEIKRNRGEKFTIKQMERARKGLELRLAKLTDQTRKDDVVTFEELGIDRLFIDEAHYFKNLFLITKMRNVGGIAQVEEQKSSDLFMKTQYLDELKGGRSTVFATGTPISNSMVELYTMQRYLQYDKLSAMNLTHFDAWASTFGETVTAIELAPEDVECEGWLLPTI
jgi:N12 class adenine-specific DNA methylase